MRKQIRGDGVSFLIIIVMVMVVSIVAYFFGGLTHEVSTDLVEEVNDSLGANSIGYNTTVDAKDNSIPIADNLAFWFFIAAVLGFWISCAYVGFAPVTIGIYIMVILLGVFLGSQAADIRDDIKNDLTDVSSGSFTLNNALFGRNYPGVLAAVGLIGVIIMYSKRSPGALPQ